MDLAHIAIHAGNIAGDETIKIFVDATLRPFAKMLSSKLERRFGLHVTDPDELRTLRVEYERIRETLGSLKVELEAQSTSKKFHAEEVDEPATKRFVDDALDISASTTLESKRMLMGVLIARRLEVKTDSDEEILLRRAKSTIADLTENQLRILAAISLVQMPPVDREAIFMQSLDEAESCLHRAYFKVARRLKNTLLLNEEEYGALVSVGAARLQDETNALQLSEDAPPFDQWLHGFVRSGNVGPYQRSLELSEAEYKARYPAITLLRKLATGWQRGDADPYRRLDSIRLTPLGTYVAHLVLQRLTGRGGETPQKILTVRYEGDRPPTKDV